MNKFKIVIRVIIFIMIGIFIFLAITPIFIPKWEESKIIKSFYQQPKNSLDVIYVGNSGVYRGVSPNIIWEKYGITGHTLGSPSQKVWHNFYMIQEALKYQKPKVMVFDVDAMFSEWRTKDGHQRKIYDNMKFSIDKIEAIQNPVDKNTNENLVSYVFPLIRYHARWDSLDEKDFRKTFKQENYFLKGMIPAFGTKPVKKENLNYMQRNNDDKIGKNTIKYFEKIIQICKDKNVQLQLIEMPSPNSWSQKRHNAIEKLAKQYNVPFIDFNEYIDEIGIDWNQDSSDGGEHLNIHGAEKTSSFLGRYLKQNYSLINHQNEKKYQKWNEDLKEYKEYIKKKGK